MSARLAPETLFLPVAELARRIRSRQISPVTLAEAYLERLESVGRKLNAVAQLTADVALEQARRAEKEIRAGRYRGPLHGIPYGAKDLLSVRGIPTEWGAPPYAGQVFDHSATVVERLEKAGAVLVAKLAMIELAGGGGYRFAAASSTGPGKNPWDAGRWAGGSSSGSGIAAAAALCAFAIGSETWGSILTPASYCGVTGLRPTYGRVSRHGAMALSWTMDKIGPMCRSAEDCGLVLQAIAGRDAKDPTSLRGPFVYSPALPAHPLRIGILAEEFKQYRRAEDARAVEPVLAVFRKLGRASEVQLPEMPYRGVAGTLISGEESAIFRPLILSDKLQQLADERQREGLRKALDLRAADYLDAMRVRKLIMEELRKFMRDYDVLIAPSTLRPATPLDEPLDGRRPSPPAGEKAAPPSPPPPRRRGGELGAAGNVAGLPALSVPAAFTAEGLPLGIQIVGRPLEENLVLAVGRAFQQRTDFHRRRPPI